MNTYSRIIQSKHSTTICLKTCRRHSQRNCFLSLTCEFRSDLSPSATSFSTNAHGSRYSVNLCPTTFEGWAAVPTTYIAATKDAALPYPAQEAMINMVKARGVALDVETFDSGHTVMISQPDKLVAVIQRLAG